MSFVPESPETLGLRYRSWRPNQRELIQTILDSDKHAVLVEATTGFGKSGVAAGLTCLTKGRVLILTKTLQLTQQYLRDFPFMTTLEGKDNFNCVLDGHEETPVSRAPCSTGYECPIRSRCPYFVRAREARGAKVTVTSYAKAFSSYLGEFALIICDEGHLLHNEIMNAFTIRLPYKEFRELDMPVPPFGSIEEGARWAEGKSALVERQLVGLKQVLKKETTNHPDLRKRYHALRTVSFQLQKLADANLEAVWSIEPYKKVMMLRPLWPVHHADQLLLQGKKVVIQSATIPDGEYLARTLGLNSWEHVKVGSSFDPERHPIYFWPAAKLQAKPPDETDKMVAAIDRVLDYYPKQRGIIHTVNMTLTQAIGRKSRHRARFIVQGPGKKRGLCIDEFLKKQYSVLVSPSVTTGLDGKFELARFQIMAKVPFENQNQPSVAEKLEASPDWYSYECAFHIQQMAGRVMRDKWDYGETWILDEHFGWFLKRNGHLFGDWFKDALKPISSPEEVKTLAPSTDTSD